MFPIELPHLKAAPVKAKSDGKVLSPHPLLLLAQWWLKDEVKTYVLKYTDRFYITFQAASHECALAERTSLLLQLHCKQSRLTRTPEEELFQERYNNWVSNLWPDFVFTPRFLIHFETSMWQWHLKNNSLKWGTIIKHGTCELILFLPQIPNTLWDLNLARTPGIRSAYITNMVTTLHQITRCPSFPKIKSLTITFFSIKIMSDWRTGAEAMIY